jgi:hypothetical protein
MNPSFKYFSAGDGETVIDDRKLGTTLCNEIAICRSIAGKLYRFAENCEGDPELEDEEAEMRTAARALSIMAGNLEKLLPE